MSKTNGFTFQNDMVKQLVANGWLLGKFGNNNRELALCSEDLLGFVKDKDTLDIFKKDFGTFVRFYEFMSQIISRLNELFITDHLADKDLVNYAYTIRDKISENQQVMNQIANNSPEQAMLGDFPKAIDDARHGQQ